ncbi:MAG: hypothetical protein R2844_07765 [Caldilineales bacterium]
MAGTGLGAEHGILVKNAEVLATSARLGTVVLDKTGTITEGRPRVTDVLIGDQLSVNSHQSSEPVGWATPDDTAGDSVTDHLLQLAASAESVSEHPGAGHR